MATFTHPLQIYLDSSDFSNLSDPAKRVPFVDVERQLLAWRDQGLIDLRFSFVHVAEFAPIGPEHLSAAQMRADCITRLCGSKTLKAPGDIVQSEISSFIENGVWTRDHIFDDSGNWMSSSFRESMDIPPLPEMMTEATNNVIANLSVNRELRRKAKRRVGTGKKLLAASQKILKGNLEEAIAGLQKKYPLSDGGISAARRYFLGNGSKADVEEMLLGSLRDLRLFMYWYSTHWDLATPVTSWLREEGAKLRASIASGQDALVRMLDAEKTIGTPERELTQRMKGMVENMPMNLLMSMLSKMGCPANTPSVRADEAIRFLPGAWVSVKIASEVIGNSVARLSNQRNAKASDFGDFMHCAYLPYMDVFRVDGFVESAVRALKLPFRTTVVGNLKDLPAAIEARLLTIQMRP